MSNQFYVPICHKYIKAKDGTPNSQRIFSVAKTAFRQKNVDTVMDDKQLLDFLIVNGVIDDSVSIGDLDLNHVEMCFSIITQYKCNAICQMCGYSPLYKNQLENQEAVLLGFSLSSWNNLQTLLRSGVTCRHFRSVLPVSDKSAVSVVPINRLAFEYMEKIPKCQEDMLSISDKIIASIKQNNKDKLSASDLKIIHKYLSSLYNSNFRYLKEKELNNCLKHFKLILKESEEIKKQEPIDVSPSLPLETQDVCKDEILQQESDNKKVEQEKEISPQQETRNAVHIWEIQEKDLQFAPYHNLDDCNEQQLSVFKDYLLETPLLPMEFVQTENKQFIVLFAGEKLYYYSTSNPIILDEILPYINKSSFRKVLCYEPYWLYAYFQEQQIQSVEIFSLNIAMNFLYPSLDAASPKERIKFYVESQHTPHPNSLLYCMQFYLQCYKKMQKQIRSLETSQQEKLLIQIRLSKLLGISYFKHRLCAGEPLLFTKRLAGGYDFTYQKSDEMKSPYCSVRFGFSWKESSFPIEELLNNCVVHNLICEYDMRILKYDETSVIFAVRNDEQKSVYEAIHNLACFMAEKENKTPIVIDAERIDG